MKSDKDLQLQLIVCKAICNFAYNNQKNFSKDEMLIKKLVSFTDPAYPNSDIKNASLFTLKNILYKASREIKEAIMKELTYERLIQLFDDQSLDCQK